MSQPQTRSHTRPLLRVPTLRLAFLRGGLSALACSLPGALVARVVPMGELVLFLVLLGLAAAIASLVESAALRQPRSDALHAWAGRFAWAACSGWIWLAFLQVAFASSLWSSGQLDASRSLPDLLHLLRRLSMAEVSALLVTGLALGLPFGATVVGRLEERRGTRHHAVTVTHRFIVRGVALLAAPLTLLAVLVDTEFFVLGIGLVFLAYVLGLAAVIGLQTLFQLAERLERRLRQRSS